jgi:CrcB protein
MQSATLYAALWITLGSALGGMARYLISGLVARRFGETFPLGTLVVNVVGSFVIGFAATFGGDSAHALGGPTVRQFVMTGLCGGFTTFSSFSLQTLNLLREGQGWAAAWNVLLSAGLCLLATIAGLIAGAFLTPS